MIVYRIKKSQGYGLLNKVINKLPFELHIPGYQYCGPGTKLAKRLARGDPGINALDAACKEHDIAYSQNRENIDARNAADRILAEKARQRLIASDARISEKVAAYAINKSMKLKSKLGMGIRKKKKKPCAATVLAKITKAASRSIIPNKSMHKVILSALQGARKAVKEANRKVNIPRILLIPQKVGGILPLLVPTFAGLSTFGALAGGAARIAKAVSDTKAAKKQLEENERHNKKMEEIAIGKGIYVIPHKKGLGLRLKPFQTTTTTTTGAGITLKNRKKKKKDPHSKVVAEERTY